MGEIIGAILGMAVLGTIALMVIRRAFRRPDGRIALAITMLVVALAAGFTNSSPYRDYLATFVFYLFAGVPAYFAIVALSRRQPAGVRHYGAIEPSPQAGDLPALEAGAISQPQIETLGIEAVADAPQTTEDQDSPIKRSPSRNPIAKHWRGEYSLGVSYWLVSFLANIGVVLVAGLVSASLTPDRGYEPLTIFVSTCLVWAAVFAILVWQIVGLWRSAQRRADERRRLMKAAFWARAAQVMAVLAALQNVAAFNNSGLPQIREMARIAFQNDPDIPGGTLTLADGGHILVLEGGIKYGLARDIDVLLKAAPDVTAMELRSPGGRIAEAAKVADTIRAHRLDTFVTDECSSACTLIFVAGQNRLLGNQGRLGFHGSFFPGMSHDEIADANQTWADLYRQAGIESAFVSRALAVSPSDIWYPTRGELKAASVLSGSAQTTANVPSDFIEEPSVASVKSALFAASPVYEALDQAAPAEAAKVYELGQKYLSNAISEVDFSLQAHTIVMGAVRAKIASADDDVLVRFAELAADEYEYLLGQSATLCFRYAATGDLPDVSKYLSPDLNAREADLDAQILRTARPRLATATQTIDAIWRDVFGLVQPSITSHQRSVFGEAVGDVQDDDKADYCVASVATFRGIAALPTWKAAALMRTIF